jgi:flagellar hook protein FlgE
MGALTAGVTGLQSNQKMLDIAGNNLANINTTGFKSSSITFSELLSETIKNASQPTGSIGGTNPQQMGSGVGIANISRNMSQGDIVDTGQPLDMSIDGQGYFVLNDGAQNVYSRGGSSGVDANSDLVDPATGYHVQRIGSEGEINGFQKAGDSNIHIPYDTSLPANATSSINVAGNLSADDKTPSAQILNSSINYTVNGNSAQGSSKISSLDQFSGAFAAGQTGTITITGSLRDGTAISSGNTLTVDANTSIADLITKINSLVQTNSDVTLNSTASLTEDGKIQVTDNSTGYSKTDLNIAYTSSTGGTDKLTAPGYFAIVEAGGNEVKNVNIKMVDSQGGDHTLNASFVRTNTANTWDMVLTSVTGDVAGLTSRRIEGITFNPTGAYNGLSNISETPTFGINFANDGSATQTIKVSLGTIGNYDGITQFAGASTAVVNKQDGYEAGRLATMAVSNDGILVGSFSNGIKKDIAKLQVGLFQNPAGLESIGNGYFVPSSNSGDAIATQALSGGAGTIHGGSLEKSNVDVASEFVVMIQAQNGYQANARTITIANNILSTLTNLIR